jgi:hypothetical protein
MRDRPRHAMPCRFGGCDPTGELGLGRAPLPGDPQSCSIALCQVNPPVEVESASWAPGGTLDWWVKERQQWLGAYAVQMAVNGGSKLLIFVVLHRSERI